MIKSKKYPLLLALVTSLSLLLPGCGCGKKKEEAPKASAPPPAESQPVATPPVAAQPIAGADPSNDNRRMTAIFAVNHADKALDEKLPVLEDFISSRITEKGFSVISRDAVTGSLGGNRTEIEKMLENNSSALRLAQILGANYIIMATISTYGIDRNNVEAYGAKIVTTTHNLRVTYKILEGVQGGTLAGKVCKVSKEFTYTANQREDSGDLINDLLDQASECVAADAGSKVIARVDPSSRLAEFSVACGMQDLVQLPVSIPDVRLTADNTAMIGKERIPVLALNVMVELDGAGIGSTPQTFKVPPGLHKIRLRRDGFKDFEGNITVFQGQTFNITLQMTDAGYQRWKDNTSYLNSIETGKKLTDAEVVKLKAEAESIRKSYKVEVNKVNIEDIKHYQSLFFPSKSESKKTP